MNTETKEQKALNTLIQAVQVANKRGAFELVESKVIAEAMEVFVKQETPTLETKEEPKEGKKPTK